MTAVDVAIMAPKRRYLDTVLIPLAVKLLEAMVAYFGKSTSRLTHYADGVPTSICSNPMGAITGEFAVIANSTG
jgi:hypothetical protein